MTFRLRFVILIVLGLMSVTALAQESSVSCETVDINRQIDLWYQEYLGSRGEFEQQQALEAAAALGARIQALTEACGLELAEGDGEILEQRGDGTEAKPFDFGIPATVNGLTLTMTGYTRPATDVLVADGVLLAPPAEGIDWVVIEMDVLCEPGSLNGCLFSMENVRLTGDLGVAYMPQLANYSDYVLGSRTMPGGATRSGGIPFEINANDSNLRLLYYASGSSVEGEAVHFTAQGGTDEMAVTSTNNELLVRAGPGAGFGPRGIFRTTSNGVARGRNADSTWIFVEVDGVEGWVSGEFVESQFNLDGLPVIAPGETPADEGE